ncbi:hypothetical protein KY331_02220, partial [Candidatus Woesearchaeota archaeon]|nr:hypothetical protein [Candidatus Woesearchaeota archaeon]
MSFQDIKPIQESEFYIDLAFRRANKKASESRKKCKKKDKLGKAKYLELLKIDIINDILTSAVENIVKEFPIIDELPEFYKELTKITIGTYELKKALSNLYWIKNKINDFSKKYKSKIAKSGMITALNQNKKEFYGRISSLFKRAKSNFNFLENTRKTLKQFP